MQGMSSDGCINCFLCALKLLLCGGECSEVVDASWDAVEVLKSHDGSSVISVLISV